jgi:hypothetical protein
MNGTSETPFDNIESSHGHVTLLVEAIEEARREVDEEIALSMNGDAERRKEALQIAADRLAKLAFHMKTTGRILNDLRTLRRLLLAERRPMPVGPKPPERKGRVLERPPGSTELPWPFFSRGSTCAPFRHRPSGTDRRPSPRT